MMNKERIEQIMEKVTERNLVNVLCGNKTSEADNEILELLNEVARLTNNWNELEEYIGKEWYCFDNESVECIVARNILDKMNEIKEKNNER